MDHPENISVACPRCGAWNKPGDRVCYLCGGEIDPDAAGEPVPAPRPRAADNPYQAPKAAEPQGGATHIRTLLVAVGLLAVAMAAVTRVPEWGIPVSALAGPATVRVFVARRRALAAGTEWTPAHVFHSFVAGVGGMLVVYLASAIAFCGVCLPIGGGLANGNAAVIGGGIAASLTACGMFYLLILGGRPKTGGGGDP